MQRGIDYSFYGAGNMQSGDLSKSITDGLAIGQHIRNVKNQKKAEAQAQAENAEKDQAFDAYMQDPKNRDNMMNLYKADSKLATGLFGIVSAGDKEEAMKMKEASAYAEQSYSNIYASLQQGDFDSAKMQALQLRGEFESKGFDIKPLEDIATAQSPEQAMSIAQTKRALAGATLKVVDPLTLDQAADNERADRELALKANDQEFNQNLGVAKFGETQRSNQARESVARGNLAVNQQKLANAQKQLDADMEAGNFKGGNVGSVSPKDFTVQSLAKYQESGRVSDLVRYRSGSEKRSQKTIDGGLAAAQGLPVINRSLDLLNSIETGGFNNAQIKAKKLFGIEGADEAELSNNLGKAVLSQLKATFGAAFTVEEGKRLERLEAGLGKSNAGNKRILSQAKRMAEVKIKQAKKRADQIGDTATIDEINDYMSADFSPQGDSAASDPLGLR